MFSFFWATVYTYKWMSNNIWWLKISLSSVQAACWKLHFAHHWSEKSSPWLCSLYAARSEQARRLQTQATHHLDVTYCRQLAAAFTAAKTAHRRQQCCRQCFKGLHTTLHLHAEGEYCLHCSDTVQSVFCISLCYPSRQTGLGSVFWW